MSSLTFYFLGLDFCCTTMFQLVNLLLFLRSPWLRVMSQINGILWLRHLQRCHSSAGQAQLRCQPQFTLDSGYPCHYVMSWGASKAAPGGCSPAGPEAALGQEGSRREKLQVQGVLHHCSGPQHLPCTLMLLPQEHTGIKDPRCSCTPPSTTLLFLHWWGQTPNGPTVMGWASHWYSCGRPSVEVLWFHAWGRTLF